MTILAIFYLVSLCAMVYVKHKKACADSELSVSRYYLRRIGSAYLHKRYDDCREAMCADELFLYRGAA